MNEDEMKTVEKMEDILIFTSQEVSEKAYEKYSFGEISEIELKGIYDMLRHWILETEQLLRVLR